MADAQVQHRVKVMENVERLMGERYGVRLAGLDVLDVGTGQQQIQSAWLARKNRVVGIDLDVIPKGWSLRPYFDMWRSNGSTRVLKTVFRKALGIDRMFRRALREQLGMSAEKLPALRMDVTQLDFPSDRFDFVYCSSVLQCVPDVGRALEEMNRVLKPGGIGYFTIQLYSSETGSLDPRLYGEDRSDIPYWAHLRPEHQHAVAGNAWLNKLRLHEWKSLVGSHLHEPFIVLNQPHAGTLKGIAEQLRQEGSLLDFSIEELITHELQVSWRK